MPHGSRKSRPRLGTISAAGRLERRADGVLVVDHEPEVAVAVGRLAAALGEGDELVARVDEGHPGRAAAQAQLEDLAVEGERLVEVADLEGDVVDADEPRGHARAGSGAAADGAVDAGGAASGWRWAVGAALARRRAGGGVLGVVLAGERRAGG